MAWNSVEEKAAILKGTVAKFREIAADYQRTQQHITVLQNRLTELSAQAQDCHSTARLFGFDLIAAAAAQAHSETNAAPPVEMPPPAPSVPQRPNSIKVYVLEAARQAFPNPVRATQLRKQLEEQGINVHEKTMGMTLFRLKKEGLVERQGRDWFFVRDVPGKENPGDEPGLDLEQ